MYAPISKTEDLPIGWHDVQDAASYRLNHSGKPTLFGFVLGPQSWKKFLFPSRLTLWSARKAGDQFVVEDEGAAPPQYALIGVRGCELQAIQVQDGVFLHSDYRDRYYSERRKDIFIVAVNCIQPGGTCFCASMGTGPRAAAGYDLALTELYAKSDHKLLIEIGSDRGAKLLADVPVAKATEAEIEKAQGLVADAGRKMGRQLETAGLKELLQRNTDSPLWLDVARRCLTCANCTLVCPTCFCSTIEDTTDLGGTTAVRERRWDSCFNIEFSYIHGGSIRTSVENRYRHWITHKLASWHDQFNTSGCVGCGRCITWCPVGIDITEEAKRLRESERVAP